MNKDIWKDLKLGEKLWVEIERPSQGINCTRVFEGKVVRASYDMLFVDCGEFTFQVPKG